MTYSIVARDAATGEIGVAVQSHYFCVGNVVPWLEPGVGAVATQAMAEIGHGPRGVAHLRAGASTADALRALSEEDPAWEIRQVALVDASGATAVHTGAQCVRSAGSRAGDGFSAQGNLLASDRVWEAMAETFASAAGPLARRLLAALDAGEEAGGDLRGCQSAALFVVTGQRDERPWEQRRVDLRVDDHPDPLRELRRLLDLRDLYREAGAEISARAASGDTAGLERALDDLRRRMPDNPELLFWSGLALARDGHWQAVKALVDEVTAGSPGWRRLLEALHEQGLAPRLEPLLALPVD